MEENSFTNENSENLTKKSPFISLSKKDNNMMLNLGSKSISVKSIGSFLKQILPIAILMITCILVGYYIIFPSRFEFHADNTDTLYWAQASYDSGEIFNEDFNYACFLPFGGNLLMQMLIPFFGVSMTTQIIGMLLYFALFVAFLLLMLREMKWSRGWSCIMVSAMLMVLCTSQKLREIFWGHIIYYSLGILFIFIGMYLVMHYMNLTELERTPKNRTKRLITRSEERRVGKEC